jgi:hypothetical protein
MTNSYFLDNNIYRDLTTSANGEAIRNFNLSIVDSGVIPMINVKLRMTPFTVLEAVGLKKIPDPNLILNIQTLRKSPNEIISYLSSKARTFYLDSPILKREHLISLANKQSIKYTSNEGKELERRCVYKPLSFNLFEKILIDNLTFDYIYKFDFPQEKQFVITDFLLPSLFTDHSHISGLSKFRWAKKFWDKIYQNLNKTDLCVSQKEIIEGINKSMKLKKLKDFLDCEIIHKVLVGDFVDGKYRPSIAFTSDNGQDIINRIMVYKSFIEYLSENLSDKVSDHYRAIIAKWHSGMVVFCNSDGTFKGMKAVNEIEAFK